MRNERTESEYAELKQLIIETKKIAEETRAFSRTTKNFIRWIQLVTVFRFLLVAVPLALAVIYLPTILRQVGELYSQFFGGTPQSNILEQFGQGLPNQLKGLNLDENKIQEILKGLQK